MFGVNALCKDDELPVYEMCCTDKPCFTTKKKKKKILQGHLNKTIFYISSTAVLFLLEARFKCKLIFQITTQNMPVAKQYFDELSV